MSYPVPVSSIDTLAVILREHGCMSENQLTEIARSYPGLMVGIKMGCSTRILISACAARDAINSRIAANPADYVREAFIPVGPHGKYDELRQIFGIAN